MILTKEEFNVLLILYAAGIDGNVRKEEVEEILEHTSPETYRKVQKSFSKMSDIEVLDLINENKKQFVSCESDRQLLLDQLSAVINADDTISPVENHLFRVMDKIL